jgi:hypothetical protein
MCRQHLFLLLAVAATLPCGLAFSPSPVGLLPRPSFAARGRAGYCVPGTSLSAQIGVSYDTKGKNWRRTLQEKRDAGALAKRVFETDKRPIILYDGICNLCNGGVNFMLDWDSPNEERGNFRFAALQSEVGKALLQRSGRRPDDVST